MIERTPSPTRYFIRNKRELWQRLLSRKNSRYRLPRDFCTTSLAPSNDLLRSFTTTATDNRNDPPLLQDISQPGSTQVMGPEVRFATQLSSHELPSYSRTSYQLFWRNYVRYWYRSLLACADGGDSKSKGATVTLGKVLFPSLPSEKQQLVEKFVAAGELIIDPTDGTCRPNNRL